MKTILAAALISVTGFTATAGNIAYVAPSNVNIEMEPNMNIGSGSWLIPLVIVAVLALALTQSADEEQTEG